MTQQQVADELGADRSTVAKIESSVNKKGANSTIKKGQDEPQFVKRGSTAKNWTIAKLRREGKDDIAAQVESGAMMIHGSVADHKPDLPRTLAIPGFEHCKKT